MQKINEKTALKQLKVLSKKSSSMRLAAEDWESEFQILISTILSARTKDEITILVCEKLFSKYPTAKKLSSAKLSDVEKIIRSVNFYKNKSKNIIHCSKQLVEGYKEKIPHDEKKLILFSGVGGKTANVFLSEVGKDAIGVDTHVSYISQKLGWSKNQNSDKIQKDLENLFSKKNWSKINSTLVRFGKTFTSRKEKDKILEEVNNVR